MIPSEHIKTTLTGYLDDSELCMYIVHDSENTELKLQMTGLDEDGDQRTVSIFFDIEHAEKLIQLIQEKVNTAREYQAERDTTVTVKKTNG